MPKPHNLESYSTEIETFGIELEVYLDPRETNMTNKITTPINKIEGIRARLSYDSIPYELLIIKDSEYKEFGFEAIVSEIRFRNENGKLAEELIFINRKVFHSTSYDLMSVLRDCLTKDKT